MISSNLKSLNFRVIFLTLSLSLGLSSCSYIQSNYAEVCKSRAYVKTDLLDYISTRYHMDAPVRMGIYPYSVPANLSNYNSERPGVGEDLARLVHSEMLLSGDIPLVEILNRKDWPGKKEEFFSGNFGAIAQGREAGYDLVLIGFVDRQTDMSSIKAYSKLIDTESGVTLWYGETNAQTNEPKINRLLDDARLSAVTPSKMYFQPMLAKLAQCISGEILKEEPAQESFFKRLSPF